MRAPLQRSSRSNPASSSTAKRGSTPTKKRKVSVEAGNGGGPKKKPPSGLAAAKLVTKKVKVVGAETKKLLPASGKAKVLVVVKKVGTKKTAAQKKTTKPVKKLLKKSKPQISKKIDHGDSVSSPGTSVCECPGPRKTAAQQQVTKGVSNSRIVVASAPTPAARKTLVRKAHKIVAPVVKTKLKKTLVEKVVVSPKKTKTTLLKKKVMKKMSSEAAQAGPSAFNSGSGSNSPTTSADPETPLQDSSTLSPTGSPSSCRSNTTSTGESFSSKKTKETEASTTSSCKKSKETDKKENTVGQTIKFDSTVTGGCKSPKGAEIPAGVGCKKIKDTEAAGKKQKDSETSGSVSCKKLKDIETQCTTNAKKVKDLENSKKMKETEHSSVEKTKETKLLSNGNKKMKDLDAPLSTGKKKTKETDTTSSVSKKVKETDASSFVSNKKVKEGEIGAKVMANASTNTSIVTKKKLLPNKSKPKVESKDVGTLVKPDQNVSDQAVVTATIVTIVGEGPETVDRGEGPKSLEKTDAKYCSSNSSSGKRSDDDKPKTKKPKIKKKMLLIASDPKNAANTGASLKKLSTKIMSSKLKKGISKKSDSADEMKKKIIAKMVAKKAASILGVDFDETIKADIKVEDVDNIEYLECMDSALVAEETTQTDEDRKPVVLPCVESVKTALPSGEASLASSQPSADDDSSTSDEITLDLLLLRQQEWKRAQQARALEDGFGSDSGTEGKLANIKTEPAVTAASDEENLKPLKVRIREKLAATVAKAAVAAVANLPSSNSSGTESPSRGKLSKKLTAVKIEPKDDVKTEIKRESSDDEASSSSGKPQPKVKKKRRAVKTKGKKVLTADNSGSDTEQRARRMKLFGFWSGPKRHRVASLNALAKVHCLYENESRGALLGLCGPNTKVAVTAKKPTTPTSITRKSVVGKAAVPASTRTLRSVPGLREPGRNWDMQNASSTTSSSPPTSSSEDNSEEAHKQPLHKKRMLKKKTSASSDASKNSVGSPQPKKVVRRKRNRAELTMDLKDMVVRKRMASLNASAILAASYSAEKRLPKPTAFEEDDRHPRKRHKKPGSGTKSRRKASSRDVTTSDDDSDSSPSQPPPPPPPQASQQQPQHSPQQPPGLDVVGGGGVIELRTTSSTTSPSKKVAMIQLNQDTDVTITGVYVNSTTRSTRHEGFCSIAGMQYRISSTSHTQTEATAVATETVQLHPGPEHPPSEAVPPPLKSYTPLGALSSMQPPGHHPQHRVVSPLGAGVRRVQAPPPPQGPVPPPPPPPHACGASAFSAPPPPTYGPPQPPPDPAYIHGYYQPAGPLISAAAASHHLAPPPHVGGGSKAQQQHAALPPTPTPPPTSQTGQSSAPSTRDESSDNDVTIIATGTSSEVMPQYRYPSQQPPPPPQQYGYGYPHTPQYYPSPPASSLQYPPHYHSHQDLCYPPPPYFHHKSYSTPPPPPSAAARYHQRYLPQYYEAPPPPPPAQQQSGTSTQQMVSTSSSGSGSTGYQAVGPPAPASSDSYGPPPPPIVEPYPPPPGYYGYGAAPGAPACYSHSPPTRSLAYIDAAYQSCPCPMQSCPKNVHTGPLTGDGKGPAPNSTSKASSLPPIALALPLEIPGGALGPPSPARGSAGMPPPPSPATAWGPDQQQQALMATASATPLACGEDGRVSNDHVHKSNFSLNEVPNEKCSEEIVSHHHQQEGQTNLTLVDPKLETSPLVKQESRITIISEETVKHSEMRNDKPSSPLSRKRRLSSGGGKVEITEPVVAKKPRDENVTPAAQPSTPKVLEAVQQEKSFPEQETSKELTVKEEHLPKINGVQHTVKQNLKKKKCKTERVKQTVMKKRQTQPKIYPSRTKLLCINNNKMTGPQAIDNILLENRACQKQMMKEKLNKVAAPPPRSVGRPKSKQQAKTEPAKKKLVTRRLSTTKQHAIESSGKKVSNSNSALVLHRKMTIPKRLTNTPKWSNGWSWEGTPFEAKVFLTSDDVPVMRTCYPAMRHVEGDLVCPHDSVLLKSGPRKLDLPFVAKVAALWENPDDGEMMVSLLWYYRPEHTEQGCIAADAEDEIFASKHKDINSVACIEDKCYVLTFNEYCRYRKAARRQDEGVPEPSRVVPLPEDNPRRHFQPPGCVSSDLVFYCRRVYDFRQKRIVSSRVQGSRYGRTLGRHRARRLL